MVIFTPKEEDAIFLAYKLKEKFGTNIRFGQTPFREILTGTLKLDGVRFTFFAKYSMGEFLRITVTGRNGLYEKKRALLKLEKALCEEKDRNDVVIGMPIASFDVDDGELVDPFLEWAFVNREEYAESLRRGKLIEDAELLNLIIYGMPPQLQRDEKTPRL